MNEMFDGRDAIKIGIKFNLQDWKEEKKKIWIKHLWVYNTWPLFEKSTYVLYIDEWILSNEVIFIYDLFLLSFPFFLSFFYIGMNLLES